MIRISFIFCFFFALSAHAQKNQTIESIWKNNVEINGNLNEWGDSLSYYFSDQDLHYSFTNDDTHLYIAIRVKNKDKQTQAVFNGFKISFNINGKKKEGPSLTFPLPDRAALRALVSQEFDKPKDPREGAISTIRAYHVQDFPNILDGLISLDNNYGIKASVLIDSADHLCYESAIRLDQLNLPVHQKDFAINVKINGVIRSQYTNSNTINRRGYPYGYGYGGYDQRPRTIIRNREEPGIWQYLKLATNPNL